MRIKLKRKNKGIAREDEKNNKNSNLEKGCQTFCEVLGSKILKGRNYQIPPENLNNSKIFGGGSYRIPPQKLNNSKILRGVSYQTPPENYVRIPEENFYISLYFTPVGYKEGSN